MTTKILLGLLGLLAWGNAHAFVVTINPGARTIYLRVGDGSFNGTLRNGGSPQNNTTVNVVSASVGAANLGNGTAVQMATNGTAGVSFWDNYTFCNVPAQIYIGGFYRIPKNAAGANAVLTASWPATLTNAAGDTIPFSSISWTSTGNGDGTATQPMPSGSFDSSPKTLSSWQPNTWNESCHTFFYNNAAIVPSGVFTGRVTYTLAVL